MKAIADLHIHSKYSRATSKNLNLENLEFWGKRKGINIIGTGDFTHPLWFKEIKSKLIKADGLLRLRPEFSLLQEASDQERSRPYFLLTAEISCIYSKGSKVRRVHLLVFTPSIEAAEEINRQLSARGNLASDGRPILGLDAKELAKIVLNVSEDCLIVPAHAWTPWFSVFGSKSGFDTLEECFDELTPQIYAIETGLSSDPAMNWRLKKLDSITLISNSDAHSLENLGREANVFNFDPGTSDLYAEFRRIIKEKDRNKFLYTIEFYPEEGKYHFDGHASCGVSFAPQESKKNKGFCPVCKKPLVIGVLNRVEELADRPEKVTPADSIPFKSLVPLAEIIAEALGQGKKTKGVIREYDQLISRGESEFNVLLNLNYDQLSKITLPLVVEGIRRVREGKLFIEPGYDGVYGKVKIFKEGEIGSGRQNSLL